MKKSRIKKLHFGSAAIAVTLLVLCATVILNVIAAMLASRYEWMYVNMNTKTVYSISDNCRQYVSDYIIPEIDKANEGQQAKQKIRIIFCDTQDSLKSDDRLVNIYNSILELKSMFPEHIETSHLNIWENPGDAREYGIESTGDIVCVFGSRFETVNFADFYLTDPTDNTKAIAYNGEKILASCLMRVTQKTPPNCYFTVNHGENTESLSLMRTIIESGYTVNFLDLSSQDIPADCELLVTYAPERDLSFSSGEMGEPEKLDKYMKNGGRYMVFISADTYAAGGHTNFETLLGNWGVTFMHKTANDGTEQSYLIKDPSNSLTVDGYTVIAKKAQSGIGASALSKIDYPNAFANSTCIEFAPEFKSDGKGNFIKEQDGITKTVSPLLVTHGTAQAWMGGITVARADEKPFTLMSISSGKNANGKTGHLIACASTEFASQNSLGSAVLGNSRVITEVIRYMGRDNAPSNLVFKSFSGTKIESLTTSAANTYTVVLALVPTLTVAICGTVILVRRKYV